MNFDFLDAEQNEVPPERQIRKTNKAIVEDAARTSIIMNLLTALVRWDTHALYSITTKLSLARPTDFLRVAPLDLEPFLISLVFDAPQKNRQENQNAGFFRTTKLFLYG